MICSVEAKVNVTHHSHYRVFFSVKTVIENVYEKAIMFCIFVCICVGYLSSGILRL